jgi:hypothetical protein
MPGNLFFMSVLHFCSGEFLQVPHYAIKPLPEGGG